LPRDLLLSASERVMVESHLKALHGLIAATPGNDEDARRAMLAAVAKMMLVLPSQKASEAAGEAKAEAFDLALSDVPVWAINEAVRGWYRGQYGDGHNYTWQPVPTTLRSLAFLELSKIRRRISDLEDLLNAKPARELPPPSERPTSADIRAKLQCLQRAPDAPVVRQDAGHTKRALADLAANKLRRELAAAPSAFELDPDNLSV
jgi:hypothetical protein